MKKLYAILAIIFLVNFFPIQNIDLVKELEATTITLQTQQDFFAHNPNSIETYKAAIETNNKIVQLVSSMYRSIALSDNRSFELTYIFFHSERLKLNNFIAQANKYIQIRYNHLNLTKEQYNQLIELYKSAYVQLIDIIDKHLDQLEPLIDTTK